MKTSNLSTRVPNTAHPSVTRRAVVLMGQILPLGKINLLGISPSPLSLPGRRSTSTWVRLRSSGIPQVSDRLFPLSNLITSLRGDCRVSSGHGRGMRTRRGMSLRLRWQGGDDEHIPCSPCSVFTAHSAQIYLTKHTVYTEPGGTKVQLTLENNIVARTVRRSEALEDRVSPEAIASLGEYELAAVRLAFTNGKVTARELAEHIGRDRRTASRLLGKLVGEGGLLEWHGSSPNDPRQFYTIR